MFINRGKEEEDVVHIFNGIFLSQKKKQNWVIYRDVDGSLLFISIQLWRGHPSSPFTKAGGRLFRFRTLQVGCVVFLVLSSSGPNPSLRSFSFVVRKVRELGEEKIFLPKGQCCCHCCGVAKSCLTLCDPMDCSTPDFLVLHHLLEFARTCVPWANDAIQPSHPLLPPSLPALNLSRHQGIFQWVGSSNQGAEVLEFQLQYQSFQWIFRVDFL